MNEVSNHGKRGTRVINGEHDSARSGPHARPTGELEGKSSVVLLVERESLSMLSRMGHDQTYCIKDSQRLRKLTSAFIVY